MVLNVPTEAVALTVSAVPEAVKVVAPEIVLAEDPVCVYDPLLVIPVTPVRAPELMIKPLMVLTVVGAVMAPAVARVPVKLAALEMV
mgnify:CR=1 FL=1